MPDEPKEFMQQVPIAWDVPEDLITRYVTNMVIQHTEHEFLLSFFETVPPIILSAEPQEMEAALMNLKSIHAKCADRCGSPENAQFHQCPPDELRQVHQEGGKAGMNTAIIPVQDADSYSVRVGRSSASRESLYPVHITIGGKIAPNWELIRPIEVGIARDTDGSYVVSDDVFDMFGHALTAPDAIRDYLRSLVEYYELVSAHEGEPSTALLVRIQEYLRHIPA